MRDNKYFQMGLTAFAAAAAILLFYDTLFGGKAILALAAAMGPILMGAFIAYMLAPSRAGNAGAPLRRRCEPPGFF